jgi:hemerythrin-like domain-containing protein
MMPIGPLMIEHRLIERMIKVMSRELKRIEGERVVDPVFVDTSVDFIRNYADRCHHGKEEDILFRDLKDKSLAEAHRRTMEELIEEHKWGREKTAKLVAANQRYATGEQEALSDIISAIKSLIAFYPKHIEKEDKHFFIPVMDYFSTEEKDAMLREGYDFDKMLIHEKYGELVARYEEG